MHVLTTAEDQRIYISTNIECVLKPQKLESTKLNDLTVVHLKMLLTYFR
jgi:hypothetical protein